MEYQSTGISDIQVYVPEPMLPLGALVAGRVKQTPRLERHLQRALRVTGQRAMRFPSPREDTVTMAAAAAHRLLAGNPRIDLTAVRHLAVGTESGVDHSKPVSAYVAGLLREAGLQLPTTLSSVQVQHACAAGTLSLLSVAAQLAVGGRHDETGVVVCSDVARYKTHTTAEVTQGAGAVSLLVERSPKLVELDLETTGYYASDVDDFFRPIGSTTAQVKGTYSMQCYTESLRLALLDHCERSGRQPEEVLLDTDYFVLHAPFRNMPEAAMVELLGRHLGMDAEPARRYLGSRGLYDGMDTVAEVGNIYTGSVYLALYSLLARQYAAIGEAIVGKSVLLASYGAGNIMVVLAGRIAPSAPEVIRRWDLDALLSSGRTATFEQYERWAQESYAPAKSAENAIRGETDDADRLVFSLSAVREDGYREYAYDAAAAEAAVGSRPVGAAIAV